VRDPALHELLQAFTTDTAATLAGERAAGAEIPFEVVEAAAGRHGNPPLYCYRALTDQFIERRMGLLSGLASYAPAARALASRERAGTYLNMRGTSRVPEETRELADAVLLSFLGQVFSDRSEFEYDPARFESAYGELENALMAGRAVATVLVALVGLALQERTWKLELGGGLSLVRGDRFQDAPPEVVWDEREEPYVLAVLTASQDLSDPLPWAEARVRFSRLLTAARLFERGPFSLGPLAWGRVDFGAWRPVALGPDTRRPGALGQDGSGPVERKLLPAEQEDEFRGFCNLMARRLPSLAEGSFGSPEMAWALARFEMGCERGSPLEALSDYILALRALLEPEGPGNSRLPQRLALICARPEERPRLAERVAIALTLERSVITGMSAADEYSAQLVAEMGEHLRALLRDALCGHLQSDLVGVAETVLAGELAAASA
jgi:hypothetical protein